MEASNKPWRFSASSSYPSTFFFFFFFTWCKILQSCYGIIIRYLNVIVKIKTVNQLMFVLSGPPCIKTWEKLCTSFSRPCVGEGVDEKLQENSNLIHYLTRKKFIYFQTFATRVGTKVVKVFVEIHLLATFWAQNVQMNVFLQVRQCIGVFLQLLVKTDKTGYKAFNMHIQQTYLNLFYILFDLLLN